ncbi:hypothetical protein [Halonotius sp. GCM10025705]|uniref:hypothetical protein n=1 Tax=Halonotius sp. GCM10025705 TaxID=3252678 RepID=UPI003622F53F
MKRRKVISAGSLISLSIIAGCSQLNRRTEEENSIIEQHLTKGSSLSISGVSITANDFLIKDEITTEGGHNTHTPTENKLYFLTLLKFENNSESEFELPSASEFVMEYNNEEMPLAELSGVIETEGGRNREVLEQKTIIPNQSHSAWIVHTLPRNYRLNQIEISFLFEREDRTIRVLWSPRERDIESRREGVDN